MELKRFHIYVSGKVQGVGFRHFVNEMANELHLGGWVRNADFRVEIDVEGPTQDVEAFKKRLRSDGPVSALVEKIEATELPPKGFGEFKVERSV